MNQENGRVKWMDMQKKNRSHFLTQSNILRTLGCLVGSPKHSEKKCSLFPLPINKNKQPLFYKPQKNSSRPTATYIQRKKWCNNKTTSHHTPVTCCDSFVFLSVYPSTYQFNYSFDVSIEKWFHFSTFFFFAKWGWRKMDEK